MRKLGRFGPMLGRAEIGGIQIDVKSRDDIPAILLGLQGLYLNEALREAIFELLLDRFGEDCDLKVGRPGMELWTVLVLAVLKQGLGCDFDRLREHANTHVVLRQLLGHSELEPVTYSYDQVIRNVSLLDEDTLRDINELVVRHGPQPLRPRRRRAAGGPVRQLCRRDGCPLSHRPQLALGRSPGDGTDRGRAGGRMEPVRLASSQASYGDAPAAVSAGGEHPALGGLAGGRRRVPGQVRGTAGEGGGHAGRPAGAGRLAGGARGPRPVHRAYEAPDRPDGPEDPAGGG